MDRSMIMIAANENSFLVTELPMSKILRYNQEKENLQNEGENLISKPRLLGS